MTGSLNFPVFLYSLLGMLGLGTFLTETRYGPQTGILISGFYLAAAYLQRWFFDPEQMFRKKTHTEAIEQIVFAGDTLDTEAGAAHEKRTLDKVLKLPVQIKLRIGMFGMVGLFVSLVLNHTLQMHFTLFFHLITALLILPAMTPNHFMLPCVVNLIAVTYGFSTAETPDFFLYAIYVLILMFVIMSFGNVQREVRQTHAKPLPVAQLTLRTLVSAVQTGVAFLFLLGIVDYFVPHPGKTPKQQRPGMKSTMIQLQAMLGRAMPDAFKPQPGPSGAPNPSGKDDEHGFKPEPSPEGGGNTPSGTPAEGPNAKPSPSAAPSANPSAKPSTRPSSNPEKPPSPPPFPLPSVLPSLTPEQVQSLAREALKQGLFDEKDLKRGELNLKPEVQKLLTPDRVKQAMEDLKKMSQAARAGDQGAGGAQNRNGNMGPGGREGPNGHLARPKFDPTAAKSGALKPNGAAAKRKENEELQKALGDILKQARTAIADTKTVPPSGTPKPDQAKQDAGGGKRDNGSGGSQAEKREKDSSKGGGSQDDLFQQKKKKEQQHEEEKKKSLIQKTKKWVTQLLKNPLKGLMAKFDLAAVIDDLFTPILLALILGGIWYFRKKLSKKADPRRVSRLQLARDQRSEILKRLKELGGGKLSAREEVIARYDLFLRIMEFAATPREIYLPPTDFLRRIRYLHPELENQSQQLTDIFCDVFYGDYSAGDEEVRKSRGAVKEIYHYFAD